MSDHTMCYCCFYLSYCRRFRSHFIVFETYANQILSLIQRIFILMSWAAWIQDMEQKTLETMWNYHYRFGLIMCCHSCKTLRRIQVFQIIQFANDVELSIWSIHFLNIDRFKGTRTKHFTLYSKGRIHCGWIYTLSQRHCAILAHPFSHHTKSEWECLMQSWIAQK